MKEIILTQNKIALVDDQDYDLLMNFKWCAAQNVNTCYALTRFKCLDGIKRQTQIYMHQLIIDRMFGYNESALFPDHKDRDGLNNQRYNLRRATRGLNMHNSKPYGKSKYRGVHWSKQSNKWKSQIWKIASKHLGYFDNEEDAAKAYDVAALIIYGNDACLNFKKE